jgi:hypothetical protein
MIEYSIRRQRRPPEVFHSSFKINNGVFLSIVFFNFLFTSTIMYLGSFVILLTLLSSLSSVEAKGDHHWNLYKHLGNLTPYNKPNVPKGIHETLPRDCEVVQVMLVRFFSTLCDTAY